MTDAVIGRALDRGDAGSAGDGRSAGVPDNALGVDTIIYPEDGRWAVEISARLIKRGAERDPRGPMNG